MLSGQVTVEFHVEKETNFIVIHAQDLNITEKVTKSTYFIATSTNAFSKNRHWSDPRATR